MELYWKFFIIFRLDELKIMVHRLYEDLNVKEHIVQKENEILKEIDSVRQELLPFEEVSGLNKNCN